MSNGDSDWEPFPARCLGSAHCASIQLDKVLYLNHQSLLYMDCKRQGSVTHHTGAVAVVQPVGALVLIATHTVGAAMARCAEVVAPATVLSVGHQVLRGGG